MLVAYQAPNSGSKIKDVCTFLGSECLAKTTFYKKLWWLKHDEVFWTIYCEKTPSDLNEFPFTRYVVFDPANLDLP